MDLNRTMLGNLDFLRTSYDLLGPSREGGEVDMRDAENMSLDHVGSKNHQNSSWGRWIARASKGTKTY